MVRVRPTIKEERGRRLLRLSLVSHYPRNFSTILTERRRQDVTRQARRNPWMRSNQRPFARDIIAGRVYYVPLYARPTENLQNAFLNECEIVQVRRAPRQRPRKISRTTVGICRRGWAFASRPAYKFLTNAATREIRETKVRSLIFISTGEEDHLPDLERIPEETVRAGLCVFLLVEILSVRSLCDLKRSTIASLCPSALQSVKLKWILCCFL